MSCQPNSNVQNSHSNSSPNSSLEITKTSWYSEDQINTLLKHYLPEDKYFIAAQSQLEHKSLIEMNVIAAIKAVTNEGKISVLPIQIHGNHWVAAVIRERFPGEKVLQVIFNNPMGSALSNEGLNAFNFLNPINNNLTGGWTFPGLRDLKLKQQKNSCDCGPFTVDNLVKLAKEDNLSGLSDKQIIDVSKLEHPNDGSACHIRKEHMKILNN